MKLFLCASLLLIASNLEAQKRAQRTPPSSPYERYATEIRTRADSVMRVEIATIDSGAAVGGSRPAESDRMQQNRVLARLFANAAKEATRLAKDFDAIVPPADLARLHEQLVSPLIKIGETFVRWSDLQASIADPPSSIGDVIGYRATMARRFLADLPVVTIHVAAYKDSRERAERLLLDKDVRLEPFPFPP